MTAELKTINVWEIFIMYSIHTGSTSGSKNSSYAFGIKRHMWQKMKSHTIAMAIRVILASPLRKTPIVSWLCIQRGPHWTLFRTGILKYAGLWNIGPLKEDRNMKNTYYEYIQIESKIRFNRQNLMTNLTYVVSIPFKIGPQFSFSS